MVTPVGRSRDEPEESREEEAPETRWVASRAQRHGSVSDVFARQLRDARVLLAEGDPLEAELWPRGWLRARAWKV